MDLTLLNDTIGDNGLTDRENYFLDILFDDCSGDIPYAMKLAGYHPSTSVSSVTRILSKEIAKRSREYLASQTAKASIALVRLSVEAGGTPGVANQLKAIESILNRGGVNKEEDRIEVKDNVMIMLPPKMTKVTISFEDDMKTIEHGDDDEI